MTKNIIIVCLCLLLAWRESIHAERRAALVDDCDARVQWAIQDTGDSTLDACERRIDEILGQF